MRELLDWLGHAEARTFPYSFATQALRCRGKQFADDMLLRLLDVARGSIGDSAPELRAFLDVALDKYDDTFSNQTYLALDLLDLPAADDAVAAQQRRDRLHYLLISDLARFEADERGELAPDAALRTKRLRLAERALAPIRERIGVVVPTADDEHLLRITMLPVTRIHDERLFIRAMQTYEATFAVVAAHLGAATQTSDPSAAVRALTGAEQAMAEAAPLFSLVATMQPEAFLAFRDFTQGATAMQSPHYGLIRARLAARRESATDPGIVAAESALSERFQMWRQTHFRIARRLLGDLPGTGATDGAAYLDRARTAA